MTTDLPAHNPAGRHQHQAASPIHDALLTDLLARQVTRTPYSPAVRDGSRSLTYRKLDELSGAVARSLARRGIRTGDTVAVLGVRSWEAVVAAVGVLKAGAVCMPIDAQYPSARATRMLADGRARAAVALPGHSPVEGSAETVGWTSFAELIEPTDPADPTLQVAPAPAPDGHAAPDGSAGAGETGAGTGTGTGTGRAGDGTAYVLFTSGTTGNPKPVAFPHRAVSRLAQGDEPWCPGPSARVLQTFGLSFDGSLFETWATLLTGGCLVVAGRDVLLDTAALQELMSAERITHVFMTTSLFHHTVRTAPGAFAALEMVLIGGEAMDTGLTRAVQQAGAPRHLINGYGPTEGGIMVTAQVVGPVAADATSVSIGRPVAGSSCHLLRDGVPVAPGEEGEIFIGGDGVALGYLDRAAETRESFVERTVGHDDPGGPGGQDATVRLYRSGDRARRNADGTLEFLGRVDRQVKVRGFRIELEAVEAALRAHRDVAQAAVLVSGNDGIGKGLTGYVTPADPARPVDPAQLRRDLRGTLPAHAVPAPVVPLDHLPLTSNGKVDYPALAALAPDTASSGPPTAAGTGADPLAGIWAEVLGTPVSDATDFFAEGGNSLLAAQTVTRTIGAFGLAGAHYATLLRGLLDAPTLGAFRAAVDALPTGADAANAAAAAPGRDEEQPDFAAEARLDPPLPSVSGSAPQPTRARHVLLTGATGFVGAFLLERLLRDTGATVHCPVRAADGDAGLRRIHDTMARFGLPAPDPGRVQAYPADLAAEGLGLAPGVLDRLADTVDLVVHNAAHVNFLYPYRKLRDVNVGAVRTLVALAGRRRVPLHHVSTTAILAGSGVAGTRVVDESTPLGHPELISMGYAESKWVAEHLLHEAAGAGLPVTVYRPYEITGHSRTGAWNTDSAICSVFDAISTLGAAPDVPLPLDLVPVDHVADAIVGIATRLPHLGGVVHLTNPRPAMLGDMVDRMRAAGYLIEDLGYEKWVEVLLGYIRDNPASPIAPFAPLFVTRANQADFTVKEMYFDTVFPEVARTRTDEVWPAWQRSCPPVDSALLDHYIRHLQRTGLL